MKGTPQQAVRHRIHWDTLTTNCGAWLLAAAATCALFITLLALLAQVCSWLGNLLLAPALLSLPPGCPLIPLPHLLLLRGGGSSPCLLDCQPRNCLLTPRGVRQLLGCICPALSLGGTEAVGPEHGRSRYVHAGEGLLQSWPVCRTLGDGRLRRDTCRGGCRAAAATTQALGRGWFRKDDRQRSTCPPVRLSVDRVDRTAPAQGRVLEVSFLAKKAEDALLHTVPLRRGAGVGHAAAAGHAHLSGPALVPDQALGSPAGRAQA